MRGFIVLCFVAAVYADQLGYNYQPVGHSDGGLSANGGLSDGSSLGAGSLGAASNGVGSSSLGGLGGAVPSGISGAQQGAEYEKEFYSFTASENDFNDGNNAQDFINGLKKKLRVVFIKGPENTGLENAALALAKHAADQKEAIYVLNKQTDLSDLANKLNAANNNNRHKPEVHFVKYRTPEDAANAQNAIQSQYDQLGGSSQIHSGGLAPTLNFASPSQVHTSAPRAPGNAYLPSSIFRVRI